MTCEKINFSKNILLALMACLLIASCSTTDTEGEQLMIFAAASLSDVMNELVDSFEVKKEILLTLNLASSGTLARQIEQGQLPDVYLSASKRWADYIDTLGLVLPQKQKAIAQNSLVLVAPVNSKLDSVSMNSSFQMNALLSDDRLSMGDPNHVPAGKYAKQSLLYYGWYSDLETKIIPAKDVRSALMVVELGEVPLGIVYLTDAMKSNKVKVLGVFNAESHEPITYIASQCKSNAMADEFYEYINSEAMSLVWEKYGFKLHDK